MRKQFKGAASILIAISLIFGLSSSVFAAKKKGKDLYKLLNCESCHGKDGKGIIYTRDKKYRKDKKDKVTGVLHKKGEIKNKKGETKKMFVTYPKLAGQNKMYLYNQMKDIFSGKRTNALSTSMYDSVIKAGLLERNNIKDKDLKRIAKYLSKVK